MVLSRAQDRPGPDGILDDTDTRRRERRQHRATNTDSPWVDQSQTYTSHSSHQVFLREYSLVATAGRVSTGQVPRWSAAGQTYAGSPDGTDGHLHVGIGQEAGGREARPAARRPDVTNIPMLATDPYGNFIPGPVRGLPQYVTATGLVEGDLANPVAGAGERPALQHAVPDGHRPQRRPVAAGLDNNPADAGVSHRRRTPTTPRRPAKYR